VRARLIKQARIFLSVLTDVRSPAQTAELRAKHGIILSCGLRAPSAQPRLVVSELEKFGTLAEGERYGKWPPPNTPDGMDEVHEAADWLRSALN
jgi:hypothetical protein